MCRLCNMPARHSHILEECLAAKLSDKIFLHKINKLLDNNTNTTPAFSTEALKGQWAIRGIPPIDFWTHLKEHKHSKKEGIKIWKLLACNTLMKWRLHCFITHSKQTPTLDQLQTKITDLIKIPPFSRTLN
jgi:hypothetical protein